jgi:hypothetical protein
MKITYLKNTDPYQEDYSDDDIVVENVHSLDDSTLINLLQEILATVNHPNRKQFKNTATELVKHNFGLITPEEAKTLANLKIKGRNLLFPIGGFAGENIEIETDKQKLDDYTIKKIVDWQKDNLFCSIQIEVPSHIQSQIDVYKEKIAKEKRAKDLRKKNKELERARKILEKAGEKV